LCPDSGGLSEFGCILKKNRVALYLGDGLRLFLSGSGCGAYSGIKMGLLNVVYRVQGISLKWKLLIPFLGLAFVGTVSLVYIGLASQYRLIRAQEKKRDSGYL